MKVGLIGLGKAGTRHADAVRKSRDGTLIGAADPAPAAIEAAKELKIPCYATYQELLAQPDLDAVIVSLPHGMLAQAAIAVAKAGKHLLLEKPMGVNLPEVRAVVEACDGAGVKLMVNYVHRFRAEYRQALELIRTGVIGRPVILMDIMASGRSDLPGWTWDRKFSGGGMMMYNGSHSIDRLAWLAQSPISSVSAAMGTFSYGSELEDNLAGTLTFASGAIGVVVQHKSDAQATMGRWSTIIYGTQGSIQIETGVGLEVVSEKERFSLKVQDDDRFLGAFMEFSLAIAQDRDPLPSGRDGLRTLEAVLALYQAANSKTVVSTGSSKT